MPGGHVPKQRDMRLQSCDLAKQKQDASPFRAFPSHVRFDEEKIRQHRAEPAERGDEPELSDFFAEIEIYDIVKFSARGGSMLEQERALGRKFHHAKREQHSENDRDASHKREHTSPRFGW